ncbi:MAG: hypothetical protein V7636_2492 [Actinomycetota bacterium]
MDDIPDGALASRSRRALGYAIDVVTVAGPLTVIELLSSDGSLRQRVSDAPSWMPWAATAVVFLYQVLLTARDGQTIGKKLMRTRVVEIRDLGTPTLQTAAIRALPTLASPIPIVGTLTAVVFLPVAFRADRRGAHDHLARTAVISADL